MKLSPRREKFAQAIAEGMTQADAYRAAYSCSRMKSETIWNNASALMKNSEVLARVDELKEALAEKQLWKREDSVKVLRDVLSDPDSRASDKTAAVKVLNEMHGYNAPQKVEHSGESALTVVIKQYTETDG